MTTKFRGIVRIKDGSKQKYDIEHPDVNEAQEAVKVLQRDLEDVISAFVLVPSTNHLHRVEPTEAA